MLMRIKRPAAAASSLNRGALFHLANFTCKILLNELSNKGIATWLYRKPFAYIVHWPAPYQGSTSFMKNKDCI